MFSLYQTAKLLNFQNIKKSYDIYKSQSKKQNSKKTNSKIKTSSKFNGLFVQYTFAFEYHYLKAKLLVNYNSLLNYINNINIYNDIDNIKNKELLNLKFPRKLSDDVSKPPGDLFTNFGIQLLMEDKSFDDALNIVMETKAEDKNLRMTKIEIPL